MNDKKTYTVTIDFKGGLSTTLTHATWEEIDAFKKNTTRKLFWPFSSQWQEVACRNGKFMMFRRSSVLRISVVPNE